MADIVTLHTEGVDWNISLCCRYIWSMPSPSTRRVWIEIWQNALIITITIVTLHTEGVDWNFKNKDYFVETKRSPSTRRVWIEIILNAVLSNTKTVTLHTEGVDWNNLKSVSWYASVVTLHTEGVDWNSTVISRKLCSNSHPPHGGCGLKSEFDLVSTVVEASPSTRRVWIEIAVEGMTEKPKLLPSTRRVWIEILFSFQTLEKN